MLLSSGLSAAVVGMAKNCGKTVTLASAIARLAERGTLLGVASAGRDGESVDAVTSLPKPPIWLGRGSLVATSERLAARSQAALERVAVTAHASGLGRLGVYRVRECGTVEVGGANRAQAARDSMAVMRALGAGFIVMDGAVGRRFSCAPSLAEATVLATGAAAADAADRVVERTVHAVEVLATRAWQSPLGRAVCGEGEGLAPGSVLLCDEGGGVRPLFVPSVLACSEEVARAVEPGVRAVVLPGALTGTFLGALVRRARASRITVVVRDATRILAGRGDLARFRRWGGQVAVIRPIRLVALTTNPLAPDGRRFDPAEFLDRMARTVAPLPVFDVVAGLAGNVHGASRIGPDPPDGERAGCGPRSEGGAA